MHLPVELQENLVLYLPLGDKGIVAHDYSKYGNHGDILSSPAIVAQTNGTRGHTFSGDIAEEIIVPDDDVFSGLNEFTVMIWFVPTRLGYTEGICDKRTGGTYEWQVLTFPGSIIILSLFNNASGGTDRLDSVSTYEVGVPIHITCTYSKSNTRKRMYINGLLEAEAVLNFTIANTTAPVHLGNNSGYQLPLVGGLSEFMIFNKELTQEEIKSIYKLTYRR